MVLYDSAFFSYVNTGAISSAEHILPLILNDLEITSVLDVGCGQGAWLSIWKKLGVNDICGIDGLYVDQESLLISKNSFIPYCLSDKFDLGRRFDLVQTLEVAEHLPKESAVGFIESIINHGDLILFSAATKGQGGDNHVNEQDYDYWRQLFAVHGYIVIDYFRLMIRDNKNIEPWYRYNLFLYVSSNRYDALPEKIKKCCVQDNVKLQDISPLHYKIRKRFVSFLPVWVMTKLAKIKEFFFTKIRTTGLCR